MPRTCGKRRRASTCRFLCDHCGEYLSKSQYARHRELFFKESSHPRVSEQGATFTAPDPFSANDSSDDEMRENATGKLYKWTAVTNIHGIFAKDCIIPFVWWEVGGGGRVGNNTSNVRTNMEPLLSAIHVYLPTHALGVSLTPASWKLRSHTNSCWPHLSI